MPRRKRRILESDIEDPVVKYARKEKKCLVIKLNLHGQDGWPDRQFFGPGGRILLIEFKKPGEEPTPYQADIHKKLGLLDHDVYVIDSVDDGKEVIDRWLKAKPGAAIAFL